jgi:hypothetical protein
LGVLFSGLIILALGLWSRAGRRPAAFLAADGSARAAEEVGDAQVRDPQIGRILALDPHGTSG